MSTRRTKVISLGDCPDFQYFEEHLDAFKAIGFDGWVMCPTFDDAGTPTTFYNGIWGVDLEIPWDDVTPLWDELAAPPNGSPVENFIRANATPGDIDWFDTDGIATITENFRRLAILARESFTKGIFFDCEPYQGQLWTYAEQPDVGSHTLDEYKTQVKAVANAMGLAMWAEFPDCQFWSTLNYWVGSNPIYDLLDSFLDGLLDSMEDYPCVSLTFAQEQSYLCNPDNNCFNAVVLQNWAEPYFGGSDQFVNHAHYAMSTWATYNLTAPDQFDNADTSLNYFTPEGLTDTLELAAQYTQKYLWVYTGEYGWVSNHTTPYKLSDDYKDSINNALPLLP